MTLSPTLNRDSRFGVLTTVPARSRPEMHGKVGSPQPKSLRGVSKLALAVLEREHLRCFPVNRVKANDRDFHQHFAVIFYLRDLILGRMYVWLLNAMKKQNFLVRKLETVDSWLFSDCLSPLPRFVNHAVMLLMLAF